MNGSEFRDGELQAARTWLKDNKIEVGAWVGIKILDRTGYYLGLVWEADMGASAVCSLVKGGDELVNIHYTQLELYREAVPEALE